MRLGKKPRMRRAILLLMAGVMLSCLGIFLSLPQTTASEVPDVPAAPAGENGGSNAPPPEESYPLRAAGERQKKDELPVNASLLTMLVLAISSFGGSVLWLLATNARRQAAICSWGLEGGDRRWLAAPREGASSFLGVFQL
jgi:hypothetical protein